MMARLAERILLDKNNITGQRMSYFMLSHTGVSSLYETLAITVAI